MATATAETKKMTPTDRDFKVVEIENRNREMYQSHGEAIERGEMLRFWAGVFAEQKFLLEEITRLRGQLKKLKAPLEVE